MMGERRVAQEALFYEFTIKRGVEIPDRRMRRQLPEAGNDGYPSPG
ncbi:hypothetical protein AB4099_34115 [Bosea sp. 2KB_26]